MILHCYAVALLSRGWSTIPIIRGRFYEDCFGLTLELDDYGGYGFIASEV